MSLRRDQKKWHNEIEIKQKLSDVKNTKNKTEEN